MKYTVHGDHAYFYNISLISSYNEKRFRQT